jgi:hypothetical protein
MRNIFRKKTEVENEIAVLENQLRATLLPVFPRLAFVVDLQNQLKKRHLGLPPVQQPQQNSSRWLLVSGVIGSILMLITSIRGIVALYGVINLLVQRTNRNALPRRAAPAA